MPVDFVETPQDELDGILAINVHGTLAVTRIVLPGMLQRCTFSFVLSPTCRSHRVLAAGSAAWF
jgi:short-subunit dehydrogenase